MAPATGLSPRGAATWMFFDGQLHLASRITTTCSARRRRIKTVRDFPRHVVFDDRVRAFDAPGRRGASEYRDQYWWRHGFRRGRRPGGRVLAAHTRIESERSGSAELPGVGSGALTDERQFTINSLQADGWWRVGSNSLLQAGVEWRQQDGRYEYEDHAEFALLFLTTGAAQEPTRTRSLRVSPSGHQSGAYVNWQ